MSMENKRAEKKKTADFSQAGQDDGNNSPFRHVSSSALSLPASPPPFLLTPYMVCSLKGIFMFMETLLWMPGTKDKGSPPLHKTDFQDF